MLTDLEPIQILQGSFSLIWVIFAIIIGLRVIWKAITLKRKELITVGLTWILIASAWWGVALQFITYGFFNYQLTAFQYLLVANVFIPLGLFCWSYSYCEIINPKLKKNFFLVILGFIVIWELFLWIALFINTALVGTIEGIFDSKHSTIALLFVFSAIIIFLITGTIFSVKSMKVDQLDIKWKGRFLLLAWILFTIAALIDAALDLIATLILARIILLISSVLFYFGFFLPEFLKQRIIKK